jgi:hypothetical protein
MNLIIGPHHVALFEITMLILNNAFIVSVFFLATSPLFRTKIDRVARTKKGDEVSED